MPKRKKSPLTDKQANVIRIEHYKKQIEDLKAKGNEEYHPKYGRQIAQIQKKLNKVA